MEQYRYGATIFSVMRVKIYRFDDRLYLQGIYGDNPSSDIYKKYIKMFALLHWRPVEINGQWNNTDILLIIKVNIAKWIVKLFLIQDSAEFFICFCIFINIDTFLSSIGHTVWGIELNLCIYIYIYICSNIMNSTDWGRKRSCMKC